MIGATGDRTSNGGSTSSRGRGANALALLVVAFTLVSAAQAITKPFWYDEVCTAIVARLPDGSAVMSSLRSGADTNPPLFYLIARLSRQIIPDDHLAYRFPSLIGFIVVVVSLYKILSNRFCNISALAGSAFVLCTPLAPYAYEARPYALMAGCVALAMLAWQQIHQSRWNVLLLTISLASAVSLHYYAVFVWPAFGAAEIAVWWSRRRFRPEVWAALLIGVLPIFFFAGLLLKLREYYGDNFWASAHLTQVFWVQSGLFGLSGSIGDLPSLLDLP